MRPWRWKSEKGARGCKGEVEQADREEGQGRHRRQLIPHPRTMGRKHTDNNMNKRKDKKTGQEDKTRRQDKDTDTDTRAQGHKDTRTEGQKKSKLREEE